MKKFVITYFDGEHPANALEQQKHFAEYMQWVQSLGNAAISPMNPFKDTHTVHRHEGVIQGSSSGMSGYTVVKADSIEEVLQMAEACPFLNINGMLEVSELVEM